MELRDRGDPCATAGERFSGSISLRNEGARRAEIAYGAHPGARGRGAMTTAVRLLLDWGFGERDLETISWLAERGNFASRRVAWRAGFRFGGVVPRWLEHRDLYPDAWIGALHRDDPREPQTTWYDVPALTGDTIRLRPQRDGDVDRIVEGCNDEATAYWLSFCPRHSPGTTPSSTSCAGSRQPQTAMFVQWAVADHRHRPAPRRRRSAEDQARLGRGWLLDAPGRTRPWRDDRGGPRPGTARLPRCGCGRARPEKVVHQGGGGQRRIRSASA